MAEMSKKAKLRSARRMLSSIREHHVNELSREAKEYVDRAILEITKHIIELEQEDEG